MRFASRSAFFDEKRMCFGIAPAARSTWTFSSNITSVIAPQWDAALGRIEVVIPISALSSTGGSGLNRWSNLNVTFAYHNVGPNTWSDADLVAVHDRLTDTSTAPIVGNLER